MQRDAASLLDILDSAQLVRGYVDGKACRDPLEDVGLQDKVGNIDSITSLQPGAAAATPPRRAPARKAGR